MEKVGSHYLVTLSFAYLIKLPRLTELPSRVTGRPYDANVTG